MPLKSACRAVDAAGMAVPQIDLVPQDSPSTISSEVQATPECRMGPIGRAAFFGWYIALASAAILDALATGKPAALLAGVFVAASTVALLWAGGVSCERALLRSLLVGLIGLISGVLASMAASFAPVMAAEYLCFGAMSMLFGVMAALPLALMTATRSAASA